MSKRPWKGILTVKERIILTKLGMKRRRKYQPKKKVSK